jgi:two-component system OmpR family response regulator
MSGQALCVPARQDCAIPLPSRWTLAYGKLHLDLLTRALTVAGRPLELQPRQFDVLAYLIEYAGRFVDEDEFLERMWRSRHDPRSSVVRVQISLLRKALGEHADVIETGINRRGWRVRCL